MIYFEVHENGAVLRAFRKAFYNDPNIDDNVNVIVQMEQLGKSNNMKVCGEWLALNWETHGFEFPDEESLTMFLLKWG